MHTALLAGGFTGSDLTAAAAAVTNLVIGSAAAESAWPSGEAEPARARIRAHLLAHAADYPGLAAHPPPAEDDWDTHFEKGMNYLLAGLATSSRD